jgi:hypothetical protein
MPADEVQDATPAGEANEGAHGAGAEAEAQDSDRGRSRRRSGLRRPRLVSDLQIGILLAAAALFAAIFGSYASVLLSRAESAWQESVRLDIKRAGALSEDVRYVYQGEAPLAFSAAKNLALYQAVHNEESSRSGATKVALEVEASVDFDTAKAELKSSGFDSAQYLPASGGIDVGRRLADVRNERPNLVHIDPLLAANSADSHSRQAERLIAATIPLAVAFLLGALARGFAGGGERLVRAGFIVLAMGVGYGIVASLGWL